MGVFKTIDGALEQWEHARISSEASLPIEAGNDDCNVWSEFGSRLVIKQHIKEIPNIADEILKIQKLIGSIGVASRVEVVDLESGGQTLRIVNPRLIPFKDRLKYLLADRGDIKNRFSNSELEDYLIASMRQKIEATMWCISENKLIPDADSPNWGIHPVNRSLILLDFFGAKDVDDVKKLFSDFLAISPKDYSKFMPDIDSNFCDGSPLDLLVRIVRSDIFLPVELRLNDRLNNRVSLEILNLYREIMNDILSDKLLIPPLSTRVDRGEIALRFALPQR